MGSLVKPAVVLMVVCMASGILLSLVYGVTNPKIEEYQKQLAVAALKEVFPDADNFESVVSDTVWFAEKQGQRIGLVFRVFPKGYGGEIPITVGIDSQGKIVGVFITKSMLKETPGLGVKVAESEFLSQFVGRKKEAVALKQDGGEIEGITAATISSRAVTDGIRKGVEKYLPLIAGAKGFINRIVSSLEGVERKEEKGVVVFTKGKERVLFVAEGKAVGYGGEIEAIVAVDHEGKIKDLMIVGSSETEGIGTRITEEGFMEAFKGKDISTVDEVDAISGATISSKAAVEAVKQALEKVQPLIKE